MNSTVATYETIGDKDYDFVRRLIYEHSRINLGPEKKALVGARLAKRLRALNLGTYQEYCRLLKDSEDREELSHLVDVISTNHTRFFREEDHFQWLKSELLPKWRGQDSRPFRVWSAACSSGEEPYTVAIVLAEYFGNTSQWSIEATDISSRVLETAEQGIYDEEKVASMPPEILRRYFQRGRAAWAGRCRIKELLRQKVTFRHLNLFQPSYPFRQGFQVIFCRNVMIYFDRPTQEDLIGRLRNQLEPGGHLLVGHSESLSGIRHGLVQVRPAIYRNGA